MAQSTLEITDKDGWRREFPLQKSVTYIGSDPTSDIVLETWHGTGVAPRHVQIISLAAEGLGYRLVNLGDSDILLGASGERPVSPRSFSPMSDGERMRLGDFALVFHAGEVAPTSVAAAMPAGRTVAAPADTGRPQTSDVIGLKVSLPGVQLSPDRSLDGTVNVSNLGNRPGVQFKLVVEGLASDCYEIGPGPVLFPGAEKPVMFRLCHPCKPQPLAGEHRFSIRATAPDAYPGESAVVFQTVDILPFYSHRLRLVS
jgi:hypothetical protein